MKSNPNIYMLSDDKILVEKTLGGDYKAFEEIVLKYKDEVFNVAFGITASHDMAEDVSQEVFVKAYFGLEQFRFESNLSTWLYRITKNTAYNFVKKENRHRAISIDGIHRDDKYPEEKNTITVSDRDHSNALTKTAVVENILKELPEKYKTPLVLREFQNMRYEEIARTLDISVAKVKIRIYRARQMIKKFIPRQGDITGLKI